jgi:hypothetical protein
MLLRRVLAVALILSPGLAAYWAWTPEIPRSSPVQTPPPVWLKPARFMQVTWNQHEWHLVSGRMGVRISGEDEIRNVPVEPGSQGWYTFSCDGSARFLFHAESERLVLYRNSGFSFHEFAWIPLPLTPGNAWISGVVSGCSSPPDEGRCSEDCALLRVDFAHGTEILHSLWFDRAEGLVRWDGAESTSIFRAPGNMIDIQIQWEALSYSRFRRIDDSDRFAPYDCEAPPPPAPRASASRDESTHGRKLYFLFAKDRVAYLHAKDVDQPDGQVVVKESWIPGSPRTKGPLFLMLKSEGEWIYATTTPDGMEITASGKIASCRDCHESERTRDRMFGLTSCAAAK